MVEKQGIIIIPPGLITERDKERADDARPSFDSNSSRNRPIQHKQLAVRLYDAPAMMELMHSLPSAVYTLYSTQY